MKERGEKPQRNNLALQFKRQKHAAAESVTKGAERGSLLGFDASTCQIVLTQRSHSCPRRTRLGCEPTVNVSLAAPRNDSQLAPLM